MTKKYLKFAGLILIGMIFSTPLIVKAVGKKAIQFMVGEETRPA